MPAVVHFSMRSVPLVLPLLLAGCIQGSHAEVSAVLPVSADEVAEWPAPGAALDLLIPPGPAVDRPIRVYLDPGHGTGRNHGNRGARCQSEEDAMLELAVDLAARLPKFGEFEIRSARPGGAPRAISAARTAVCEGRPTPTESASIGIRLSVHRRDDATTRSW